MTTIRQNHDGHGDNVGGDSITRSPSHSIAYTATPESPEDIMFGDYFFKAVELTSDEAGALTPVFSEGPCECLVWIDPGSIESVLALRSNDETDTLCIIGTSSGRRFRAKLSDCISEIGAALNEADRIQGSRLDGAN